VSSEPAGRSRRRPPFEIDLPTNIPHQEQTSAHVSVRGRRALLGSRRKA